MTAFGSFGGTHAQTSLPPCGGGIEGGGPKQKATVHVFQDGARFYVHADAQFERLISVVTCPFIVKDWNLERARAARAWFVREHCPAAGWAPEWMVV